MSNQPLIGTDVLLAAQYLRDGKLVGIPTETVYGLAANALNEDALLKIFEAKQRPKFNPLIVHVASVQELNKYVSDLPVKAKLVAEQLMPGPITLLLPKKDSVPDLATAGSNKVAIRIPNHPLTLQLLQALDFPLCAPSANPFGYVSPTTAEHVATGLGNKLSYVLDGDAAQIGLESTIAEITNTELIIHRLGGMPIEKIEAVTGMKATIALSHQQPQTPGQLKSHYAPATPLYRGAVQEMAPAHAGQNIAAICFTEPSRRLENVDYYVLSPAGDLHEAAKHLFATLREIDQQTYDCIIAEYFPSNGIGLAINDRLDRAQAGMK